MFLLFAIALSQHQLLHEIPGIFFKNSKLNFPRYYGDIIVRNAIFSFLAITFCKILVVRF